MQDVRRSVHTKVIAGRARDLPETALRTASLRPTTPISAAPLTCLDLRPCEVVHGVVNPRRIDGKDGVAGSIPARLQRFVSGGLPGTLAVGTAMRVKTVLTVLRSQR
jgi:hypothetical protein